MNKCKSCGAPQLQPSLFQQEIARLREDYDNRITTIEVDRDMEHHLVRRHTVEIYRLQEDLLDLRTQFRTFLFCCAGGVMGAVFGHILVSSIKYFFLF